ncbi:MAG: hypothetical protein LQ337_006678 [Flavoplaca oasis]|nr:MAG: hypothetical protein LQ337_006678 [Flavoplaca oasis]
MSKEVSAIAYVDLQETKPNLFHCSASSDVPFGLASLVLLNRESDGVKGVEFAGCETLDVGELSVTRSTFIEEHPNERLNIANKHSTTKSTRDLSTSSSEVSRTSSSCTISNSQALLSSQSLHATQKWNLDLPKEHYYTSLFVSKFNTEPVDVSTPFSWLHHGLLVNSGNGTISNRFAQNLTQAFFGQYFAQREVMNAAQAEYGRNLLILKSSLDVPELIGSEDLFRAILTAVIFELITQTSSYAWL